MITAKVLVKNVKVGDKIFLNTQTYDSSLRDIDLFYEVYEVLEITKHDENHSDLKLKQVLNSNIGYYNFSNDKELSKVL